MKRHTVGRCGRWGRWGQWGRSGVSTDRWIFRGREFGRLQWACHPMQTKAKVAIN